MDDHNVPSVNEMVSFVDEVKAWLAQSEEHVIAVHCKGGKGRTGTMICILLVEMGLFKTATESLDYFAQRRTDTSISNTFQGVETASQIRGGRNPVHLKPNSTKCTKSSLKRTFAMPPVLFQR